MRIGKKLKDFICSGPASGISNGLMTFLDVSAARLTGRRPRELPILYLEVIQQCNLRCRHCGYASSYPVRGRLLSTDEWKQILTDASGLKTRIVSFSGGEPFLRDDLVELMQHAASCGLSVHVNSNGTLVDEAKARSLASVENCAVIFSLDHADIAANDAVRGTGSFEAVRRAVANVRKVAPEVHVGLNTVIGPFNQGSLKAILDLGVAWGVQSVKYLPAHSNLNHSWRETPLQNSFVFGPEHIPAMRRELAVVKKSAAAYGITTNSKQFFQGVERYILGQPTTPCYVGTMIGNVDPYGYLFPCYNYTEDSPNVLDGGIEKAWRSEGMKRLSKKVLSCDASCWCSGYAEPSLRMNPLFFLKEPRQLVDDIRLYFLS